MKICATTIVSANYVAYARVLGESVREHFASADFAILVVDRRTPATEAAVRTLPGRVIWAEDLGLPDFERLAYQFDILELNTALKPTLLSKLLGEGYDAAIYWDPDIRLFASPDPVVSALLQFSVVLTPHTRAPLMDGRRPSDIDIMRHGSFNLGFIAVRGDTTGRSLLDWWEDRCLTFGFNDPALGTFVDQKWMDLAPCYFESVHVLRDPGCNVAYWNLHERTVERRSDRLMVADRPLVFFHFSGVNALDPTKLSKYQDRHELESATVLEELVATYCDALLGAGHRQLVELAYTFGTLSDGSPISAIMRRALPVVGPDEPHPFDASRPMHTVLREHRIAATLASTTSTLRAMKINTSNFNHTERRVVWVNRLLRLAVRLLGIDRVALLLRYVGFLARGSNLAAALTGSRFVLTQMPRTRDRAGGAGRCGIQG